MYTIMISANMRGLFVPRGSIMVGVGLCERVYGLAASDVHEVVSVHPPATEWDLRRRGWFTVFPDIWTDGAEVMKVHTQPIPVPEVSALRWTYDGRELKCLDPDHVHEIYIEPLSLDHLKTMAGRDDGWMYVDPVLVSFVARLAKILPMNQGLDKNEVDTLYQKCTRVLCG